MSPDLERLIQLQHLDSTIDDARRSIATHPQRLAETDTRLNDAKQRVDAVKQRVKDNQDARRALEKDVSVYQGRLSKFRDQQAAVKNNREYQALGHEIETAQRDLGGVEEKILEQMVEADAIAEELKEVERLLAVQQKEVEAEKKELAADLASVEASLKKASDSRAAVIAQINPQVVARFEQVAKARKGVGLSRATYDGLCSACHVRLRPHVFQQIRQNDGIIQCDSCQRNMYYQPPPPPVEQAVTHRS